jgi:hypothetical protein
LINGTFFARSQRAVNFHEERKTAERLEKSRFRPPRQAEPRRKLFERALLQPIVLPFRAGGQIFAELLPQHPFSAEITVFEQKRLLFRKCLQHLLDGVRYAVEIFAQ